MLGLRSGTHGVVAGVEDRGIIIPDQSGDARASRRDLVLLQYLPHAGATQAERSTDVALVEADLVSAAYRGITSTIERWLTSIIIRRDSSS